MNEQRLLKLSVSGDLDARKELHKLKRRRKSLPIGSLNSHNFLKFRTGYGVSTFWDVGSGNGFGLGYGGQPGQIDFSYAHTYFEYEDMKGNGNGDGGYTSEYHEDFCVSGDYGLGGGDGGMIGSYDYADYDRDLTYGNHCKICKF